MKIRNVGAVCQGDPCCSTGAGPAQSKALQEGCWNCGPQSLRTPSGRSAAIPEAAAHLSGMQRSELLTTCSNWTIFPHLSAKQLHQLSRHICADREGVGQRKFLAHFSYLVPSFLLPLSFFLVWVTHHSLKVLGLNCFL